MRAGHPDQDDRRNMGRETGGASPS